MPYSDADSVDELDLSVRAANACLNHGIRTVGQLRALHVAKDLAKIGLGAERHRKAIAQALVEFDARPKLPKVDRFAIAKAAMLALSAADRAKIHAEVGCCACASATKFLVESPRIAAGAVFGGLIAALCGPDPKKKS